MVTRCQSAFNGDPLSASEYDPPPGGWDRWGGVRDPLLLSEVETTAQPDLFYADHPRLPFHRCTTKRSFCNQTRWVKLDADFPPSGSSLQAFPHGDIGGTLLVADDDVAGESLNGTAYGLSGAYAISAATTINFAYGNGSAESDTQKFGFGVVHDLGGGASLVGGIGQTKVGGGDGRLTADFGAYFDF